MASTYFLIVDLFKCTHHDESDPWEEGSYGPMECDSYECLVGEFHTMRDVEIAKLATTFAVAKADGLILEEFSISADPPSDEMDTFQSVHSHNFSKHYQEACGFLDKVVAKA